MKGFKFKLQSVLDARENKFKDAQLEFAKVKNKLMIEKNTLDSIYKDLEKTKKGLENIIQSGVIDHTLTFCHQNYISKLHLDIENQKKLIQEIEKELTEKNQLMLEALKQKTMMEKLKEKAMEEFKRNIERLDMLNIDEIATNRHKKAV